MGHTVLNFLRHRGTKALWILPAALIFSSTLGWAGADTLVVKDAEGKFSAGAATSWSVSKSSDGGGDSVTFVLAEGVDAAEIAGVLRDRLFNAKVSVAGEKVTVVGVPNAMLLEQLSSLSLAAEGDPLADLSGLGDTVLAMGLPEAGGSIRASKPTALSAIADVIEHQPNERLVAEVVRVTQGEFPQVRLKLRVRSRAKSGESKKLLRRGKVFEAAVLLAARDGSVNFNNERNRLNLGAYYLTKGDRVMVHAVSTKDGKYVLDFVQRKKP